MNNHSYERVPKIKNEKNIQRVSALEGVILCFLKLKISENIMEREKASRICFSDV